ncbi:MAG TPA: hypothetical protein VHI73_07915 [Solirubrobacteraceae bacterium]|nr:hypothetical protein [Solirubrobacteraceae bacterium]
MTPEEQLEREAAGRRLAVAATASSVALQVLAVVVGSTFRRPTADAPGAILDAPRHISQHAAGYIASAALLAGGYVLLAPVLDYLYGAAKARRPDVPSVARFTAYAGPILLGLGLVALQVLQVVRADDFLSHHPGDYFAARRVVDPGAAAGLLPAGAFALGFALGIISLNAMRVGLLTRFMGVLGIIVGVLIAIQLGGSSPVLWFWLGALAYLLAGRWPGGVPPAWQTGRAQPWPTAQELRARREREQASAAAPTDRPAPQRPRSRKRRGRGG